VFFPMQNLSMHLYLISFSAASIVIVILLLFSVRVAYISVIRHLLYQDLF